MNLIDLIVNQSPPLKTRKLLDQILHEYKQKERIPDYIEPPHDVSDSEMFDLKRILIHDELMYFSQHSNYGLQTKAFKFEGYVQQYNNILWSKLLRAVWSLLTSILIPFAVAYFTVKFTVGSIL